MSGTSKNEQRRRRLRSGVTVPECTQRRLRSGKVLRYIPTGVIKKYDDIVKSPEDKREYRGLQLANRLKVLLISDSTTDKSAGALDVNIGYLSDPDELPGLAHFCEHVLYLGSIKHEKYLKEIEYIKFLSTRGGSSIGATSPDHTTFYFDVLPQYLAEALNIFAQLFISPLFTETVIDRELSAVNSEHEKNLSSDSWRLNQLIKSTADSKHPFHKFSTGNKMTLGIIPKEKGIDVRKELLKFHQKWYSANIMTLVVTGKESLDELEKMVVKLFSAVEDKSVTAPTWPDHPFPSHLRGKRTYCNPVKDIRFLSIDFPIPDTRQHYKSGPVYYLSLMLEYKGPGSLLSALKARGWCSSLVLSERASARGFAFFGIRVDLTEAGVGHIDEIVELVFQYVAMMKEQGPQRRVWEEQRDLMALEFRFQDVQDTLTAVEAYAILLQDYPMQDILSASYLMTEWRPDLIENLLALLTPENVMVEVVAKCFEKKCTQTEPWYGTKYIQEDIDKETLAKWKAVKLNPEFRLMLPNDFIPARLELEKSSDPTADAIAPAIIKDTPLMRLWYKQDNEFLLPKAFITLDLVSPLACAEPAAWNLTSVLVLLLQDALQQFTYAAELAGLSCSLKTRETGLSITVDGYDDKQHVLMEKIIDHIVDFKTDPMMFEIMMESHIRAIKNFEAEQPYLQAIHQQALCLSAVVWTPCEVVNAAKTITPEQLDNFTHQLVRKLHIEALMFGNLTRERAMAIANTVESKLPKDATPLLAQQLLLCREVEIEKGAWYLRSIVNSVHKSSCASLYYACGVRETRANVTLELLVHALSERCFTTLRMKEQLGYVVFCDVRLLNGVQGLRITVQSDRHPEYLEERIESFIEGVEEYLNNVPDEDFLKNRAPLAAQLLERPKRISSKASQLWSEITSQTYNFDRPRVEADEVYTVTKTELFEFFKKHIAPDSPDRRKLSTYVVSTAEGGAGIDYKSDEDKERQPVKIEDLVEFKSRLRLLPHPAPAASVPRKGAHY